MAFASNSIALNVLTGSFVECDKGNTFEYMPAKASPFEGYDSEVFVANLGETRFAKVLKTVAYIVIDESETGEPVVEKWSIKKHRIF